MPRFQIGERVQIADCSGVNSNKTGVITKPVLDNRLIAVTSQGGEYRQFDHKKEVFITLDDGETTTMFKNHLRWY